ncbi:ANTAR domain-containing protein [Isoptericola sp. NPDC057653]|uniref:ANTAR domain-containing protein n=1 Tax=Isoptericola sp. NPDC057653 TaxID=3346195 RepID=UPI0036764C4A
MNTSELLGLLARALTEVEGAELTPATRLCRACFDVLGAQGGTVTVAAPPGEQLTITTSGGASAELSSIQELLGDGPGHTAIAEDRIVVTPLRPSTGAGDVFSLFAAGDEHVEDATWYAVPMRVGGVPVGALGLYVVGTLARSLEDAQFLADAVGTAVLGELDEDGSSTRAQVHQATGMVSIQLRLSPPDALAVLRAHAFVQGTTLEAVADDVVARRLSLAGDGHEPVQSHTADEA